MTIKKQASYLIFCDGTFAIFENMQLIEKKDKNDQTRKYIEFMVKPTKRTQTKYNIQPGGEGWIEEGDYVGFYKKLYREEFCVPLDQNPNSAAWLITADYNGNYIDLFNGVGGMYIKLLDKEKKRAKALEIVNLTLTKYLKSYSKNPMLFLKHMSKSMRKMVDEGVVVPSFNQGEKTEENG